MATTEFERGYRRANAFVLSFVQVLAIAVILIFAFAMATPALRDAKRKSLLATCLERSHNLAEAISFYANDSDARLPISVIYQQDQHRYRWNEPIPYPANWIRMRDKHRVREDLSGWANVTLAYSKDDKNYFCPSTEIIHLPNTEYRIERPLPAAMTYTYNGLLNTIPLSRVNDKSQVALAWEGMGQTSLNGFAFSNPTLMCEDTSKPCLFDANNANATFFHPFRSMDVHFNGYTMLFVDGHASRVAIHNSTVAPFADYDDEGYALSWTSDGKFPPQFRPDYDGALDTKLAKERKFSLYHAPIGR